MKKGARVHSRHVSEGARTAYLRCAKGDAEKARLSKLLDDNKSVQSHGLPKTSAVGSDPDNEHLSQSDGAESGVSFVANTMQ